mgnify:CR=1 FL=1
MNIFSEIHCGLPREGTGCNEATKRAFSGISNVPTAAIVLDLGCGPGFQNIELSQLLKVSKGSITAVDHNETYLEKLALKVSECSFCLDWYFQSTHKCGIQGNCTAFTYLSL